MNKPSDDIVKNLITRYISGNITEDERKQVDQWINTDEDHRELFNQYRKIWDLTESKVQDEPQVQIVDVDEEWDHQLSLIGHSGKIRSLEPDRQTSKTGLQWYKIAASVAFLFIAAYAVYLLMGGFGNSYQAGVESKDVSFDDGTHVILNAGAEISYKRSFNKKDRVVKFEGEAYFEVTPDPAKPFIIEMKNARIRVVGTEFNVRAIPTEELIEVTVTEGEVLLLNARGDKAVALKVNDKGTLHKMTGELNRIDNQDLNFLSWKTRQIIFDDTSLEVVITTLNKIYSDKKIVLRSSGTSDCSITVSFDNQTLESILKVLESTLDLQYTIDGNIIEITGTGC